MYWRINCSEHLLLQLNPDKTGKAETGTGVNGTPRLTRQRSVTYSTGTGNADRDPRRQNHTAANGFKTTATLAAAATAGASIGATGPEAASGNFGQAGDVRIVKWSSSPSGYFLAGISRQGVYLWQLYPFLLVSSLVYDPSEHLGQMVDVIWQTSGCSDDDSVFGTLFVLLSSGYIYEIAVYRRETPVLEYQFGTQHYWARGPGEEEGMLPAGLAQRRTYRLPPGSGTAVCAVAAGPGAVVATRTHVFRLTWAGAVDSSTAVREINENPLAQIQQIAMIETEQARLELYLFSDGTAHVLRHAAASEDPPMAHMLPLGDKFATTMAFGAASGVVAIGTSNGEVLLFVVAAGGELQAAACQPFGQGGDGRVSALGWTADGSAVACAHASGHVVVRSALGYELNVSRVRSRDGDGVEAAAVCWGAGGTRLFVLG
ncbi:hypothetical protein LPJ56_002221, partial [Coemansia sp. RSA 2599]